MKKIFALLIALSLMVSLCACGDKAKDSETEKEIEADTTETVDTSSYTANFSVYTLEGETVELHSFIGSKPIIVNIWGVWCDPCLAELPAFQKLYEEYKDRIEFMMIHSDGGYRVRDDEIKKVIDDNGYTFPVYNDPDYSAVGAYSVYSFPTTMLISESGELIKVHSGMLDEETLRSYLDSLLEA